MAWCEQAWACSLLALLVASMARAEPPGESSATARELFDQGRALLAEKDYARACPKFEESQRIDPGGGTLLNLALCNELLGKTATAWAQLDEALRWARRDGRADRERLALEHIQALAPRLARLVVSPQAGAMVPGLSVTRDGLPLGEASFGEALPVDPGEHIVEAQAPGKQPYRTTVTAAGGAVQTVIIPALADVAVAEAAPRPADAPVNSAAPVPERTSTIAANGGGSRTWGTALIATGASLVVAGAWFGVSAIRHSNQSDELCPERSCSNREAMELNDKARTEAVISTAFVAGGLGVAGIGTYLLLSAGPAGNGVSLRGSF